MRILILGGASPGSGGGLVVDVLGEDAIAFLDTTPGLEEAHGIPVVGTTHEHDIEEHMSDYDAFIIAFARNIKARMALYEKCAGFGMPFVNVIHPSVVIAESAELGVGNVIMAHSYIGSSVKIGDNNFMSSYTGIEHDCIVGSHCTFGPNVHFSGVVEVGDMVTFGMNIGVEPRLSIGSNSIIASGCMLTASVEGDTIAKARMNYDKRTL